MKYLLDTYVVLWSAADMSKLSGKVKKLLSDSDCEKFVSIASAWEVAIKAGIDKLGMLGGVTEFYETLKRDNLILLPIEREYLEVVEQLPHIHRDPFDRMIIATACTNNMTVLTIDTKIQSYDVPWCW